jgi:hypothetical protein
MNTTISTATSNRIAAGVTAAYLRDLSPHRRRRATASTQRPTPATLPSASIVTRQTTTASGSREVHRSRPEDLGLLLVVLGSAP